MVDDRPILLLDTAETGVHTIEMLGVHAIVTNEELASACVLAGMGHTHHSAVMTLPRGRRLALDGPSGAAGAHSRVAKIAAVWATSLDDKIRNNSVETQSIVEALMGQLDEIGHSVGHFLVVELHVHRALCCLDLCFHIFCMYRLTLFCTQLTLEIAFYCVKC